MSYLGSFGIDDYLGIPAATHRFSSGAAYAPSSLTYSIYEEGGTTGLDEDVDMVPGSPFDGVTGCYWIRRQLTAAAGFEVGKNYLVVIKATVDSVAAISMHTFQIAAKVNATHAGGTAWGSGAITAAAVASDALNAAADALLNRDMSTGTDSGSATVRTVRQALRFLRNKWSISGSTLTVTKENDTDASWASELTTNASADPVVGSDPASS